MIALTLKRILDLLISTIALMILLPIIILLTLILFLNLKGSPFFLQARPGKNGKVFKVIKFKTMRDLQDGYGRLLPDNLRMTYLGKLIRKSSLDEILQLINVLKGDMSLVGPRPLLIQYLSLYNKEQARRHEVKPGITGWAQVNGRNTISWQQKFEYDVWYVDNMSFALDMKILFLTFKKVFKREGINQEGQATAEPFKGNN